MPSDAFLDAAFFAFHTAWMIFVCVGWAWRRTRRVHLAIVALTAASWLGLGAFYGWGYCPLTDWHWQVRARLGYDDPNSYVQLLVNTVLGLDPPPLLTDIVTALALVLAAGASVWLNVRDVRARRARPTSAGGVDHRP